VASAEILRIIDVGSEVQGPPAPAPVAPAPTRIVRETAKLALWPSPAGAETEAIVTQGEPVPLIHVERIEPPKVLDRRVELLRDPSSEASRSYRLLRHRLFGMGDPRTIAVTSARAGEGKTTCAVNLALALAEDMMAQVLFLEANLRHPIAARLFGFEPHESLLGTVARNGDASPPYPVAAIEGTRLHMAALSSRPVPDARLDRTLFGAVLSDLGDVYDYIVIDAGSVLESGDADIAGESVSGVIVTARAGTSRRRDLRHAIDQLRPTPVFGTVLFDS
jgi:Mrp family chromosome partitioning ATPase